MEQEYENYNKYEDETYVPNEDETNIYNDSTTYLDDVDQQYKDANLSPYGEDIDTIDDNYKEWEDNKKEIQKEFSSYDEYENGSYYDNKADDEQQNNRYKYDDTSTKSTKYNQKQSYDNWDNDLTQHKTSTQSTFDDFTQQKEKSYIQNIKPIMPINSATKNISMNKNPFEQGFDNSSYDNKADDEQQNNKYEYNNINTKYNQNKSYDNWNNDLTQIKSLTQSTSTQNIKPIMPINSATNNMSMNKNPFERSFKRDDMSYAPKFDYWGSNSNQSNTTPKVSDYQKQQIQQAKFIEKENAQRQQAKINEEKQLQKAQQEAEKQRLQKQQRIDKELSTSMHQPKNHWLNDNTNNRVQNAVDYFTDKYINDKDSANYKPQNVSQNTQISNQSNVQRDYIPYTLDNVMNVDQQQTITNRLDNINSLQPYIQNQPIYGKDYIYLQDIDKNNNGKLDLDEANNHYRNGNGVAVVVPGKNVTAFRYPWEIFNEKQAGGFTSLQDYPVHGQVSINQKNQGILNGDYDFEMHGKTLFGNGIKEDIRNVGTKIGKWYAEDFGRQEGKKFEIKYDYDGSQAAKGFIPPTNYRKY